MRTRRWPYRLTFLLLLPFLLIAISCSRSAGQPAAPSPNPSSGVPFHPGIDSSVDPASEPAVSPNAPLGLPFRPADVLSLPAGTLLTVRLDHPLSSAHTDPDAAFAAEVDEPVLLNGKTVVPRGTRVQGHIEAARISDVNHRTGYLRLSLDSINMDHQDFPIQTASLFARAHTAGSGNEPGSAAGNPAVVRLRAGRRLTFRLTSDFAINSAPQALGKAKASS